MRTLLLGVAAAVLLSVAPAVAKDKKKAMKSEASSEQSEILKQEGQNREPGEDGTFQGKPVVEGPADWSSANASGSSGGSSASGASSGEAGSAPKGRD